MSLAWPKFSQELLNYLKLARAWIHKFQQLQVQIFEFPDLISYFRLASGPPCPLAGTIDSIHHCRQWYATLPRLVRDVLLDPMLELGPNQNISLMYLPLYILTWNDDPTRITPSEFDDEELDVFKLPFASCACAWPFDELFSFALLPFSELLAISCKLFL